MSNSVRGYGGQVVERSSLAGLTLIENEYPAVITLRKHLHAVDCFSVLLTGTVTEVFRNKTLSWEPLSFGFSRAEEEHSTQVHSPRARFLIIELDTAWLTRARDASLVFGSSTVVRCGKISALAARLRDELHEPDEFSALSIEGIVLEMIAQASRETKLDRRPPRWLERAREVIHSNYTESVGLESIARVVGVHPVHLARAFRKTYRSTVGDYVRQLRIQHVCGELSTTDAPLSEIAVAAGFYDQGHLARTFKKCIGLTPARYRAISRKG